MHAECNTIEGAHIVFTNRVNNKKRKHGTEQVSHLEGIFSLSRQWQQLQLGRPANTDNQKLDCCSLVFRCTVLHRTVVASALGGCLISKLPCKDFFALHYICICIALNYIRLHFIVLPSFALHCYIHVAAAGRSRCCLARVWSLCPLWKNVHARFVSQSGCVQSTSIWSDQIERVTSMMCSCEFNVLLQPLLGGRAESGGKFTTWCVCGPSSNGYRELNSPFS